MKYEAPNQVCELAKFGCPGSLRVDGSYNIETLEGVMKANLGDYIIKGIKGEFYPCKPDIFEQSYEQA